MCVISHDYWVDPIVLPCVNVRGIVNNVTLWMSNGPRDQYIEHWDCKESVRKCSMECIGRNVAGK